MKKLIESLTNPEFIYAVLIITSLVILAIYWDAKKRKDLEREEKKKHIDYLLGIDDINS